MKNNVYRTIVVSTAAVIVVFISGIFSCDNDSSTSNEDNGAGSTTVNGTLTLPAPANGVDYSVIIDNNLDGDDGFITITNGTCGPGITVNYAIENVNAGTYYIYAIVWVIGGNAPQNGDYLGIFGGTLNNPPAQPNAVIPDSGTVIFNIVLEVIQGW